MIKFINHLDTLISAIPIKCKYQHVETYLENNLFLKIFGDIKKAKMIMICIHGMGGSSESAYITSMSNSLIDQFRGDICVITPDMPGTGRSINTEIIWGIQKNVADVYIDDIVKFVINSNSNNEKKIFLAGFSASCGSIVNYFTDDGTYISNKNSNLITYTYLTSPTGPYVDCLSWISHNSGFYGWFISAAHGITQLKFLIKNKNISRLKRIGLDRFYNVAISNIWANGNGEYKFNFGSSVKNCDAILSKHDPIIHYDIVSNFLNSLNGINIKEMSTGGHVGFYDLLSDVRFHEKHIIESIKAQIT